jgi:TonB family protein
MKRILAVALLPKLLIAAALSGKTQDSHNVPLDDVAVTVWDAGTGKGVRVISVGGAFSLTGLPGGDYLLKAEKPGMALLLGAVRIQTDSTHELSLVLADNAGDAALVKALPPVRPRKESLDPPRTPARIQAAKLLHQVPAVYPKSAKQAHISGTVDLATVLRADGVLDDLVVLSSPTRDLAYAALLAVRQWRYSPTLLNGEPVEIEFVAHVNFELR